MKFGVVLTGSIATGKSSVAEILRRLGREVVDADEIAHEVLQASAVEVGCLFGEEVVSGGVVDRAKLGRVVFGDDANLARLENLLHPKIRGEILVHARGLERRGEVYFVDIPLFFEKRSEYGCFERSVVVACDEGEELRRLMLRNGLTREEALRRINLQMPVSKKRELATFVVDNNGSYEELEANVREFLRLVEAG